VLNVYHGVALITKQHHLMKFYQIIDNLSLASMTTVLLPLFVYFINPHVALASNADDLELVNMSESSNMCLVSDSIFKYYLSEGVPDSISKYGLSTIRFCNVDKKDEFGILKSVLEELGKFGQYDVIRSNVDSIVSELKDVNEKVIFYTFLAHNHVIYNSENDTNYYWDMASELLPEATDNYALCMYYNLSGFKNQLVGNYVSTFQSYTIASRFADPNNEMELPTRLRLANACVLVGDHNKSLEILNEVVKDAIEKGDYETLLYSYFTMMHIKLLDSENEDLIKLGHKTLDFHKRSNLYVSAGYTYYMLGEGHLNSSNLDSAYYYFRKCVDVSIANNEKKELRDGYQGLGHYYKVIRNYEQSRYYFHKALETKAYINENDLIKEISELWMLEGDHKKAYENARKYIDMQDNLKLNIESDARLASKIIEDAYDYKKNSEIKIIEKERQQNFLRLIAVVVFFILLIVFFALVHFYQNRNKLQTLNNQISDHNRIISARNKELGILTKKQTETIKHLENFAYVAAHDLKTPIRTATSFAGLLSKSSGDKLDERGQSFLSYIDSSIGNLSQMIDDLLSLSKLDADLPEKEIINLNEVVEIVKHSLGELFCTSKMKLVVIGELSAIYGHQSLMIQLFQNLIKNAINHSKTDKETIIKIESKRKDDDWLCVSIEDNSGGIPEYMISTIFDLFSSSDKKSGNGIGLATCKRIVTHYGGEIWVEVNEGVGSTFKFTIPYSPLPINFKDANMRTGTVDF
jgi:signal transduction histidine kinase